MSSDFAAGECQHIDGASSEEGPGNLLHNTLIGLGTDLRRPHYVDMRHDLETTPRHPNRQVGVELEFAGLSEARAAELTALAAKGTVTAGNRGWQVQTPYFGECEVYLDSQFAEPARNMAGKAAVDLLSRVVPVELVTQPFALDDLPRFDIVIDALRRGGASGTRGHFVFGFGVHLNVEIAERTAGYLARHILAYGLIEEFLRAQDPIDVSRRILPFVNPYPDAFVDALAADLPGDVDALIKLYLTHCPSRDHGLDMLPILATFDEDRIMENVQGITATKPRPAFHFRLPDCRIDEPDWSILEAWNMWRCVEELAADPNRLRDLRDARLDWAEKSRLSRAPWFRVVADHMPNSRTDGVFA
ncbi:amidoligase family protein [Gymnodinialimonas sp. 2305UL16-5]|uniref:amidoligase family protein n=1 Tax=Gymnodinialimonas mytili TaxID=3126503 RepID=UPI0030951A2D